MVTKVGLLEKDGTEYDDPIEISVDTINSEANEVIITTSTTETISVISGTLIRQTASGITTSFSGTETGSKIKISNESSGTNFINATIEGEASPKIFKNESFTLYYNGTEWRIIE